MRLLPFQGNHAPVSFKRTDGLGWLDDAFGCDIVAIGVQESFYRMEKVTASTDPSVQLLDEDQQEATMVRIAEAMRQSASISTKFKSVKGGKRK